MEIRRYIKEVDEARLMQMLKAEGQEWSCYWAEEFSGKYAAAAESSLTYVAYKGDEMCGYSRSLDDCGFYIYICDLLVKPTFRGMSLGRKLMECVCRDFPDQVVYVMSDVDEYYLTQGFKKEGSIFEVISNKA
ncbi:MAG: GNAT family N-acetyltransferase [Clostridia bacterium]